VRLRGQAREPDQVRELEPAEIQVAVPELVQALALLAHGQDKRTAAQH